MKNKSLYIIMIIAIILGAIIVKTKGFNYSTLYSEHKRIEIIIGKEYDLKDIEKIADEALDLLVKQMNEQKKRKSSPQKEIIHKKVTPILIRRDTTD